MVPLQQAGGQGVPLGGNTGPEAGEQAGRQPAPPPTPAGSRHTGLAPLILERKKLATLQVRPNYFKTPIPKFHFEMLLFNMAHEGPQKMLAVTQKWVPKQFVYRFLKPVPKGNMFFDQVKNKFAQFGAFF